MNPTDNHNRQERTRFPDAIVRRAGGLAVVAELGLLEKTVPTETETVDIAVESTPTHPGDHNPAEANAARALIDGIHGDNAEQSEAHADDPHAVVARAAQEILGTS